MYFVLSGQFRAQTRHTGENAGHDEIVYRNITKGEFFGEIALLYDCSRTATVIAENYGTLGVLEKEYFDKLATPYPELITSLKNQVSYYDDPITSFLRMRLTKIPYLQNAKTETI